MSALRSLGDVVRRAWPVLLAYGAFSVWGLMCLFMSIALSSKSGLSLGPEGIAGAFAVLAAVVIGHVLGNFLGLARLRLLAIAVVFTGALFVSTLAVGTLGALGGFVIIGVLAALSGYLGIASRLDVIAAWFPLSMSVGGAIIWMNTHGKVATFASGEKHAVWDPFSLICVAGGIFLLLVFLATRHAFSLSVWQELDQRRGPAPIANPGQRERTPVRAGRGSVIVIFGFTALVLLVAALLSPYLFRTREHDKGTPTEQGQQSGAQKPPKAKQAQKKPSKKKKKTKGKYGQGDPSGGRGDGEGEGNEGEGQGDGEGGDGEEDASDNSPDTENARRAAQAAMQLAFEILKWLLIAALLALIIGLLLVPPLRRRALLRHLEKPMWPVAPTARVMNLWRRALAALADADIVPEAGETPTELAQRAERELRASLNITNVSGLHEAAATVERIDYAGRGLGRSDEEAVKRAVLDFVRTVEAHLPFKKKLAANWRAAPEVEG